MCINTAKPPIMNQGENASPWRGPRNNASLKERWVFVEFSSVLTDLKITQMPAVIVDHICSYMATAGLNKGYNGSVLVFKE